MSNETANVTLRRRILAYSDPIAEDLDSGIRTLEQRIDSERAAWVSFERRMATLEPPQAVPAEAALPRAASA